MHDCDICLISYEQLKLELSGSRRTLTLFSFWRVILDEAQLVHNINSIASLAANSLMRRHAWVMTGTPVSAKLSDLEVRLEGCCTPCMLQDRHAAHLALCRIGIPPVPHAVHIALHPHPRGRTAATADLMYLML